MTVLLISSYIVCIHACTAAFIVHIVYRKMNGRRRGTREESRKQVLDSAWSVEMSKLTREFVASAPPRYPMRALVESSSLDYSSRPPRRTNATC